MRKLLVLLVLGTLILSACSNSDDGDATTEATATEGTADATSVATEAASEVATTEATTAPTEEPMADGPSARPPSTATAVLENAYYTGPGGAFDPVAMGFASGDVEAQWYQADGFFVVVYEGLDLAATGPLCPGNSIQTTSGFEYVSNAPTEGADCSSFPTLTSDPDVGPLVCQGVVSYRTAIPATTEGVLYGTIERPIEGGIMGITGVVPTASGIPEIDLALLSC